jgi:hypothetical protein
LDTRIRLRLLVQPDDAGLDEEIAGEQMTQQLVVVAGHRTDAVDPDALADGDVAEVRAFEGAREEVRHGHVQTADDAVQGLDGW